MLLRARLNNAVLSASSVLWNARDRRLFPCRLWLRFSARGHRWEPFVAKVSNLTVIMNAWEAERPMHLLE